MDLLPVPLFILGLWGACVSWVEERSHLYQKLPARWKEVVNALIVGIVPALVAWSEGFWLPEFGSAAGVFEALLLLLVPWLYSQVAHLVDLYLQKAVY